MHDTVDDIRDRLSHVVWIGGGPCAGKSRVARLIGGTRGFWVYDLDRHYDSEPEFRSGPAVRWWEEHTVQERWVDVSEEELLRRSTDIWGERFPLAIGALVSTASSKPIIAEGPGALPW